jgi:hypothetical protein
MKCERYNPNADAMIDGDFVVCEQLKNKKGELIPFILTKCDAGNRAKSPLGGSYLLDCVWPYGAPEIEPAKYAEFKENPFA